MPKARCRQAFCGGPVLLASAINKGKMRKYDIISPLYIIYSRYFDDNGILPAVATFKIYELAI